jgi:hypothetical protein
MGQTPGFRFAKTASTVQTFFGNVVYSTDSIYDLASFSIVCFFKNDRSKVTSSPMFFFTDYTDDLFVLTIAFPSLIIDQQPEEVSEQQLIETRIDPVLTNTVG